VSTHYNLARMTTSTTGTGTITLGAAASGFLSFAGAGASDGDTVTYAIQDGANSEIGYGVYTASGTTLTRTVLKSTNANAAIALSGSAQVFITVAAEDLVTALHQLSDVAAASSPTANQALIVNGISGKWEPAGLYLMAPAITGFTTIRLAFTSNGGGNAYSFALCELYNQEGVALTPASVSAWETYVASLPTSATAGWGSNDTSGSPCWFDFSFSGAVAPVQILMQALPTGGNVPQTPLGLTVEGSNDGTTFTIIGTVTFASWSAGETQTVAIAGATTTANYSLLNDVNGATPPTDGQVLVYSASEGKWMPGSGAGLTSSEIVAALGLTLPTSGGNYPLEYVEGSGWAFGSTSGGGYVSGTTYSYLKVAMSGTVAGAINIADCAALDSASTIYTTTYVNGVLGNSYSASGDSHTIVWQFASGFVPQRLRFSVGVTNECPGSFGVSGSNDGSTWVPLGTATASPITSGSGTILTTTDIA